MEKFLGKKKCICISEPRKRHLSYLDFRDKFSFLAKYLCSNSSPVTDRNITFNEMKKPGSISSKMLSSKLYSLYNASIRKRKELGRFFHNAIFHLSF